MQAGIRTAAAGLWLTACGPLPPAMDSTGGSETSTTGDPSTGDPPGPTSEPTTGTSGTSATSGTTGPEPECELSLDCEGYCEYCIDGQCVDSPGCCGLRPGPDGELELRCIGYECYEDAGCDEGYACDGDGFGGFCQPLTPIPVCERQPLMLSAIGLQGTPSAIALADLDGDGALDLIAVLPETAEVEIALGDGSGGFAASMTFSNIGAAPSARAGQTRLQASTMIAATLSSG